VNKLGEGSRIVLIWPDRSAETTVTHSMTPITGPSHLVNPLATTAHLETSASQLDGVPQDLEDSIRFETAKLLQAAGILLRLPQEVIAKSIVVLARYLTGPDGGSLLENDVRVRDPGWTKWTVPADPRAGHRSGFALPDIKALSNALITSLPSYSLLIPRRTTISLCQRHRSIRGRPSRLVPVRRLLRNSSHSTIQVRIADPPDSRLRNSRGPTSHALCQLSSNTAGFQFALGLTSRQTCICALERWFIESATALPDVSAVSSCNGGYLSCYS
jgi:hypothetical protein